MLMVPLQGMGGVFSGLIILSICLFVIGKAMEFFQNRARHSRTSPPTTPTSKPGGSSSAAESPSTDPGTVAAIAIALSQFLGSSIHVSGIRRAGEIPSHAGDASPWRVSGRISQVQHLPKISKSPIRR